MSIRLFAAALVLASASFASAADEEHPYKKVKVGDYATYKMTTKFGELVLEGMGKQTVIAKDDKEVTIERTSKANNVENKKEALKIDLTKPFDPVKVGTLPPGATVEKLKEGTEKLKVKGKEYDAKWSTYKLTLPSKDMVLQGDMKIWQVNDFAFPLVKMQMSAEVKGSKMELLMELSETGNAPLEKEKGK